MFISFDYLYYLLLILRTIYGVYQDQPHGSRPVIVNPRAGEAPEADATETSAVEGDPVRWPEIEVQ